MDELRRQVASIVRDYQWDSAHEEVQAADLADRILALPVIAYALAFQKRVDDWNEEVQ